MLRMRLPVTVKRLRRLFPISVHGYARIYPISPAATGPLRHRRRMEAYANYLHRVREMLRTVNIFDKTNQGIISIDEALKLCFLYSTSREERKV